MDFLLVFFLFLSKSVWLVYDVDFGVFVVEWFVFLSGVECSGFVGVMSVVFVYNFSDLYIKIRVVVNDLKFGNGEFMVMFVCRY